MHGQLYFPWNISGTAATSTAKSHFHLPREVFFLVNKKIRGSFPLGVQEEEGIEKAKVVIEGQKMTKMPRAEH